MEGHFLGILLDSRENKRHHSILLTLLSMQVHIKSPVYKLHSMFCSLMVSSMTKRLNWTSLCKMWFRGLSHC